MTDGGLLVELFFEHLHRHAPLKSEVGGVIDVGEYVPSDETLDAVSPSEDLLHIRSVGVSEAGQGEGPADSAGGGSQRATSSPKAFSVFGSGVRP